MLILTVNDNAINSRESIDRYSSVSLFNRYSTIVSVVLMTKSILITLVTRLSNITENNPC